MSDIKVGIYKIMAPNGKVYIGGTSNIESRRNDYSILKCSTQRLIYNSIKKYGWDDHQFEIIEECEPKDLDCRERYWQDYYDVLGDNGLNLTLTRCGEIKGVLSQEVIDNMVESNRISRLNAHPVFERIIVDVYTLELYKSKKLCAEQNNISEESLYNHLKREVIG